VPLRFLREMSDKAILACPTVTRPDRLVRDPRNPKHRGQEDVASYRILIGDAGATYPVSCRGRSPRRQFAVSRNASMAILTELMPGSLGLLLKAAREHVGRSKGLKEAFACCSFLLCGAVVSFYPSRPRPEAAPLRHVGTVRHPCRSPASGTPASGGSRPSH
jgi:hypothetical protein